MATYTATRALSGVEPIFHAGGVVAAYSTFALTAALSSGDKVILLSVPPYSNMIDTILSTDALDTGTAGTITYDVGDSASSTRYMSAVGTNGNNATLKCQHMNVAAGLGYNIGTATTVTQLVLTVHASPATGATSGNIYFAAIYSNDMITVTSDGTELP